MLLGAHEYRLGVSFYLMFWFSSDTTGFCILYRLGFDVSIHQEFINHGENKTNDRNILFYFICNTIVELS